MCWAAIKLIPLSLIGWAHGGWEKDVSLVGNGPGQASELDDVDIEVGPSFRISDNGRIPPLGCKKRGQGRMCNMFCVVAIPVFGFLFCSYVLTKSWLFLSI